MSTKSREIIVGSWIAGGKIRAQAARERAEEAIREADRADAEAWAIRMEGYGGPAQPPPTIGQCLNGGARRGPGGRKCCKNPPHPPPRGHPRPRENTLCENLKGGENRKFEKKPHVRPGARK